ncbi:S8 family serine peptidase [Lysobacter enzymogenes]|uniref:S8 family serine peptidase n=1 Tax=Lysobacter enzymogenes TaxID=69 RepID=UPI001A9691DF|nr:S8 family serine peptidase [Lysobacter enzymogenes]QQP95794.1 S8 family serine peptidase [Lysobacter enzymogenes]
MANSSSSRPSRVLAIALAVACALASPAYAAPVAPGSADEDLPIQQFIVQFNPDSPEFEDGQALQLTLDRISAGLSGPGLKPLRLTHERRLATLVDLISVDRPITADIAQLLMRAVLADGSVIRVESNVWLRGYMQPNDPDYSRQWHYFDPAGGANLPPAWNAAAGEGQTISVIDSGYLNNADADGNIVGGYDFVSQATGPGASDDGDGRDPNPYASSGNQHGTHVAGTIAAITNNGFGGAGAAYKSKLLHARVTGNNGLGLLTDVIDALVWSAGGEVNGVPRNQNPADVINMSIGGSGSCSAFFQQAIDFAGSRGAVVVVAAGNNNADAGGFQPSSCDKVIAVAANTIEGKRASYSNYGAAVDITAPGGDSARGVYSTVNGGYGYKSGTSMAAPHVSGAAALMRGVFRWSPDSIERVLKETARPGPSGCSAGCGAGILDAGKAVARAAEAKASLVNLAPILNELWAED